MLEMKRSVLNLLPPKPPSEARIGVLRAMRVLVLVAGRLYPTVAR